MSLTQVVLRLARNPGFPAGDDNQGYIINAPLDGDGKLSVEEWQALREDCSVIRFKPGDERDADGKLTHRGSHWFIHYDEEREGDDEPVYRLGDHVLTLGSYITIHESDGRDLTYRVAQHLPARQHECCGAKQS
ncbi:MAG: hypothetical protein ABMA14_00795 [Hyphomonadaceae bacterium]